MDRVFWAGPECGNARTANNNVVSNWQMLELGNLYLKSNIVGGSEGVMKEMKSGKVPGMGGFPLKCLKKGGMAVLEWLVRLTGTVA